MAQHESDAAGVRGLIQGVNYAGESSPTAQKLPSELEQTNSPHILTRVTRRTRVIWIYSVNDAEDS